MLLAPSFTGIIEAAGRVRQSARVGKTHPSISKYFQGFQGEELRHAGPIHFL